MITIKVPATLGNFGPGVASLGMALDLSLTVEIIEASNVWVVEHNLGDTIPYDETNYIVAVAKKLYPDITPHVLRVTSDIPLRQSLGSSTAALLAAIELANQLGELGLDDYTKLTLAARTEGQPANVTAALLGGVTASYLNDGNVFASGVVAPEYQAVIYLPDYQRTDKADKPTEITLADATGTAAAGNMLLAAWQSQQLVLAGQLLETDNIQRAVINDVPELGKIRQASHALDVYGSVVAGDGPAVVTLVAPNQTQDLLDVLAYLDLPGEFKVVDIAGTGLTVF